MTVRVSHMAFIPGTVARALGTPAHGSARGGLRPLQACSKVTGRPAPMPLATKGAPVTRSSWCRAASRHFALPGSALAALAGLLAGCSDGSRVLARVNGEVITLAQFNEAARGDLQRYPGLPDSAKAALLADLVERELLVQGARREGLDRTPEFRSYRQAVERQIVREALFQRLFAGPFPVSEGELKELHDRRATATRVRLIFTFDEPLARQARKALARGEAFATVADRYNPSGMIPPGGDIGFVRPGSLLPPLDDLVRTGAPGRVLGPVAGGGEGWFLLRIEERRRQPQPPLEEMRAELGEMLRQRKQRVSLLRVLDGFRAEYQVLVMPGAAQTLSGRLRPTPGDTPGLQTPPPPGPQDRSLVLARYRGGTFTLGEAYDDLLSGVGSRPDFAMLPSVQRWIEAQTLERVALAEARRRHLNEEPEVQRRVREHLENFLRDGYYRRQVIARLQVGPEDLQAAYQRHRASFVRLQGARVVSVTMRDSAGAAALAAQARHVPSLRDAAATAAAGGRLREETLAFPADSSVWARFESALMTMGPGDIAGPFPIAGGWLIFQLSEKEQGLPPFESLPAGARGQLQGAAIALQREARLAALSDSLRRALSPIVVYQDRLRRVPWPPAPAGPPGI